MDQELRIATGSVRVRSIGRDRFLNRYWWFDGAIGAYVPPEANFFDTKGRPRQTKSSVPLDWASGYLFVEEFDVGDRLIEEWDKDSFNSFKEGRESGVWGFFSEPIQVCFYVLRYLSLSSHVSFRIVGSFSGLVRPARSS